MSFDRLLCLSAGALVLAGCATVHEQTGSADPGFGEAVRWNAAMQIINPDPVYGPDDAQPGASGAKAAAAVERYRTDRVKEPRLPTTSTIAGGRGGNSGGSGGQGQGPQ